MRVFAFEIRHLKDKCVRSPQSEKHMNDTNFSAQWYGSNKGDRQAILNLIGAFTTQNPLTFHLRADGKIGRIRVDLGTFYQNALGPPRQCDPPRTKVLKMHMWRESSEKYRVFPDQYDAAQELRRKVLKLDREATQFRQSFPEFIRDNLYDPLVERKGTDRKFEALYDKINELTEVTPVDWRLQWDTGEWLEGDKTYSYYTHPVA